MVLHPSQRRFEDPENNAAASMIDLKVFSVGPTADVSVATWRLRRVVQLR